jgi:hypothetical protein
MAVQFFSNAAVWLVCTLLLTACGGSNSSQPPSPPTEIPKNITILGNDPAIDQAAADTKFNYPEDAIEAADGTIYIADTMSHVIRKIKDGTVSVFAGSFASGYNGDGDRLKVKLNIPSALQLSADQKYLLFADSGNMLLRKINLSSSAVSTFAGQLGNERLAVSGAKAIDSSVGYVSALRWDTNGNLWFPGNEAGARNSGLFYIDPAGLIHQKTLNISEPGFGIRDVLVTPNHIDFTRELNYYRMYNDGTLKKTLLTGAYGKGIEQSPEGALVASQSALLSIDSALISKKINTGGIDFVNISNIKAAKEGYLITDSDAGAIYKYSNGKVSRLTGTSLKTYGAFTSVVQHTPTSLLALDNQLPRIFLIDLTTGKSTLWAGTGTQGWASVNVDKLKTTFYYPNALTVDSGGNVFVVEQHRILKIDTKGQVSLHAGYDIPGDLDATGSAARFQSIGGIEADKLGNLYVADTYNNKVKKIDPAGQVTTLAGTGQPAATIFNVPAVQSPLNHPISTLLLPDGSLLICDAWNNAVVKLGTSGTITPFAGVPFMRNYQGMGHLSGDSGAAEKAELNTPSSLTRAANGTIYIGDQFNHRVRAVSPDGTISSFAGDFQGYLPEGKRLNYPAGMVAIDDYLYVADSGNALVVRYSLK